MLKILGALFAAGKLGPLLTTGGTMIVSVLAAFLAIMTHELHETLAVARR